MKPFMMELSIMYLKSMDTSMPLKIFPLKFVTGAKRNFSILKLTILFIS